ncbi:hypothetical protein CGC21_8555 [Leishmania donovani]|uniref:Uncharacterized protein n=1 Tax=Leishmania donovani TaxID=5661 RepID=A0A504WXW0_LEIDO|nr:hypothetical protein CGC21_8555 [Leishmania donovani]
MESGAVSSEGRVDKVDRGSIASPLPFLSATMPEQQKATAALIDAPDDIDSLAEELENATHSPTTMTAASTPATGPKVKGSARSKKKRGATAPRGTAGRKVRPESAEESTLTEKAEGTAALQQEKPRPDGASDTAASKLEGSEELLGDARLHEVRGSRSRSHSTAPHTPAVLNPAFASSLVFPPELLQGAEWERCLAKEWDLRSGTEAAVARNVKDAPSQPVRTAPTPFLSSSLPHRLSPEPLLPLLKALCEDKAYVHGAWCRYEDDLAVRRTQNSIQRKRQRNSFNKDELQPPESHWVEAPPAFTGGPRPFPTSATHLAPDSAVIGGFQWTPWRFYREKRRRSSRRPTASDASPASARSVTAASAAQPDLFSAVSSSAPVSSGGVPSLACSEVPSLPVLQVEAHVPESAVAVVPPMTPEERKGYARYVMSSGKLRHDCRDPYAFLVSRAKEMRIQWKRQHPMD